MSAALRPDADCTQMRSTPNSSAERVAAPGGARTTFFAAGIAAGVTDRIDASADAMGAAAFGLAPLSSMRLSLAICAVSAWLGLGVRVRVRVRGRDRVRVRVGVRVVLGRLDVLEPRPLLQRYVTEAARAAEEERGGAECR